MSSPSDASPDLPATLAEIREDFLAMPERERLQLLLEFVNELPDLPERYASAPGLLERIEECQSPVRACSMPTSMIVAVPLPSRMVTVRSNISPTTRISDPRCSKPSGSSTRCGRRRSRAVEVAGAFDPVGPTARQSGCCR